MLPLANTEKQKRPAVVTTLLIVANLGVFAWEVWLMLSGGDKTLTSFVTAQALVARRLLTHLDDVRQWQTLGTHMFLHGGIAHVLGNLWFLWIFGGKVEDRLGSLRYLLLYLLAGVAAAALQIAVHPGATIPMLGASGAISGVLGAYLILFPRAWIWTLVPWIVPILPVPAAVFLVGWFFMQTLSGLGSLATGVDGGVAWWAHAGGFVAGVVMVIGAKRAKWISRK